MFLPHRHLHMVCAACRRVTLARPCTPRRELLSKIEQLFDSPGTTLSFMTELKTVASVADILERELQPTIKDWLRRVNEVPALTKVPLSDVNRTGHLSKLYSDLICRLRLAKNAAPSISAAAGAHGRVRHAQGYTPSMLIEESRVFQVATFGALQLHQSELDQGQVLSDVMVIADEVDAQLMETVRTFMEVKVPEAAA
jgi:hypothetical protein